jgi:hypothetical protein
VKFDGWKEKTIPNNYHEEDLLKFWWQQWHFIQTKAWGLSTTFTSSTTQYFSHNSSSSDPNALTFDGWKDDMIVNNWHEEHFVKFWLHQCHFIRPKCLSAVVHQVH